MKPPQVIAITEVKNGTAHNDNLALHVRVLHDGNQRTGASYQIVMQNEMIDEEGKMTPMKEETGCSEAGLVLEKDQIITEGKVANRSLQQLLRTVIEHLMTTRGEIEAVINEKVECGKDRCQQQESAEETTGSHNRTQNMFLNSSMDRILPPDSHITGLVHLGLDLQQGREESVTRILAKDLTVFIDPFQELSR